MEDNWFNTDPNDGFNPEDHGIEMDEIAKMHAMADMKESQKDWARRQAERFYQDFEKLDIPTSVSAILSMIETKELEIANVNTMLDNMITIFQESEEYERCHICLQIKTGVNDRV
jgi:hypothetical protein